ncbi:hypothetical protein AMATHDRAFT_73933 [Amanita thiersii Skay4041]|uniref:Gfd2/YDR514C-like C-terminal domain-containing protein n=1 Tax=Amanita thiersii Skay4041 TaxID=703135 RepID=A0A2A9NWT4_9AGAR|nr:hypothetical protein AMATHDRAFT_73933 [Amanita thiersii Skay4041]
MPAAPVLTGYYRYTDIWFDWSKVLPNQGDRFPLKAALAHDSIVHPDHPLHVDGVTGVRLYIGQLHTGEIRLLFSSAQVDYIRYWLHALDMTKSIIPLPYSDCLLTNSELKNVSTVVYKDGTALRKAVKDIDKINKRLKGSDPLLRTRREFFERVRTFWVEKKGVWCAMDFEGWERDHQVITEFGWRLIRWEDGKEVEEHGHLIVDEYQKYRNTQYVHDHRYDYTFGDSEILNRASFQERICDLVASLDRYGPVFLVFHDNNQDIKYLRSPMVSAPLDGLSYLLPDTIPNDGLYVIDTADLFAGLEGSTTNNKKSLDTVCKQMQIPTKFLHNAGNDAYFTLEVVKSMASGNTLDIQREERWPNQSNGVQVQFNKADDATGNDDDDDDGIYPEGTTFNGENGNSDVDEL